MAAEKPYPNRLGSRFLSGAVSLSGFSVSVLLYGIVSLASISAMVGAAGPTIWGKIALGQAIGSVGGVVIAYGWNRSGPAKIACADASIRRQEYVDSVRVGLALLGPTAATAATIASALTVDGRQYAAIAAALTTFSGFSGGWYFVGLARSYDYLVLEVLPRVAATVAGIVLMNSGFSIYFGLAGLGLGPLISLIVVTVWVYRSTTRAGAQLLPKRTLIGLLAAERPGVLSSVGAAAYVAVPIGIVSVVAPAAQPTFALVDRLFRQFLSALRPLVSVMQGWTPRGKNEIERASRARSALAATFALAALLAVGIASFGDRLLHWLGSGEIAVSSGTILLTGVLIGLNTIDAVLGNAVLATIGKLELAVRATVASAVVGLPAVALGAIYFDAAGAIGGMVVGLSLRTAIELFGYATHVKTIKASAAVAVRSGL